MTKVGGFSYSEDDNQNHGGNANLPDEATEVYLKKLIFCFLKNSVIFEGEPDLIEKKIKDLTVGLYEIALKLRK